MQIDLDNKATRILVQEYVNRLYSRCSEEEANYYLYKLIHSFDVLQTAQDLIQLTKPPLSSTMKRHILDAAILHDIGRCYEFQNGKKQNIDHGKMGAVLIKKYLPQMKIEQLTTLFHNKLPSEKDPAKIRPILNYVRDADMLANIKYQIEYTELWLNHLLWSVPANKLGIKIDSEIYNASQNRTQVDAQKVKQHTFLNMLLSQFCWYYGLKTQAARKIAKRDKLFGRYKKAVCEIVIPRIVKQRKAQNQLIKEINDLFADPMFN